MKISFTILHTLKHVRTPYVSGTTLSLIDSELLVDPFDYMCMVGALQQLTMTRPDIVYVVHAISQFMHALRTSPLTVVKRIFRYLKELLIMACSSKPIPDWIFQLLYVIPTGPVVLIGVVQRQVLLFSQVLIQSPDALRNNLLFLVLLYYCLYWCRDSIAQTASTGLGQLVQISIRLFCDNISTTYLDINPVLHSRSMHIRADYHFVHEMVSRRHLQVKFIQTLSQLADIFTKGLSLQKFSSIQGQSLYAPITYKLRGCNSAYIHVTYIGP